MLTLIFDRILISKSWITRLAKIGDNGDPMGKPKIYLKNYQI